VAAALDPVDILVVGEINPDVVVADPDPVPVFGEVERLVGSVRLTVGSSSAIFACGAARLGLRVAFAGVVGDDAMGRFMLGELAARGIDVSACTVDPVRPTGATVILTSGADRAMLTALGTIDALDVDAIPATTLERARHIHSGAYFLQGAGRERLPALFGVARKRGQTTSFDTNWDPADRWGDDVLDLLRAADVFLPNAAEARRIAGIEDPGEAALELARIGAADRSDGGPTVVVKLGVDGALAARADGRVVRVPALRVDPLDTTGAGDSFDAGFLRAWLDGSDLEDCLALGVVCGALSTMAAGGVDAQPTLADARAAMASMAP
jgi:sugar/nucleoside kinase (ribokinase family)